LAGESGEIGLKNGPTHHTTKPAGKKALSGQGGAEKSAVSRLIRPRNRPERAG
jgi:hypothetical protein